jgi:hypothetical protein
MNHASPRIARMLACAGALSLASGCIDGVKVGQEGQGGGASTSSSTSTSSGTASGGDMPTAASCNTPRQLVCEWGVIGGPCGGSLPNAKDCDASQGWVCVGATADKEGTCQLPGNTPLNPGDACGAGVPDTGTCPWNYVCDAPIEPDGKGVCVPRNCTLGTGEDLVSAASVTIDGDGPTQHYDFACSYNWGAKFTGEANAFVTNPGPDAHQYPQPGWLYLEACQSQDGSPYKGLFWLGAPLTGPGTIKAGQANYQPPDSSNYVTYFDPPTITVIEMNSDLVRGSFDLMVADPGQAQKHLTGTFEVCRVPNHDPAP